MEVVKLDSCYCTTHTRCYGLAGIPNKVWDGEDLVGLLSLASNLKMPGNMQNDKTWGVNNPMRSIGYR